LREAFNAAFTQQQYNAFIKHWINLIGRDRIPRGRNAGICTKGFRKKIIDACEAIVDVITDPSFKKLAKKQYLLPTVSNENAHAHFIAFDFGICVNEANELEPKLIEMQGFPHYSVSSYYPTYCENIFHPG